MTYKNYLHSKQWQRKRYAVIRRADYKCESCGKEVGFKGNVHHKTYDNLFNEPMRDLCLLCPQCHFNIHLFKYNELTDMWENPFGRSMPFDLEEEMERVRYM